MKTSKFDDEALVEFVELVLDEMTHEGVLINVSRRHKCIRHDRTIVDAGVRYQHGHHRVLRKIRQTAREKIISQKSIIHYCRNKYTLKRYLRLSMNTPSGK